MWAGRSPGQTGTFLGTDRTRRRDKPAVSCWILQSNRHFVPFVLGTGGASSLGRLSCKSRQKKCVCVFCPKSESSRKWLGEGAGLFGPREQEASCTGARWGLHRCKRGFGWCKRLLGDLYSLVWAQKSQKRPFPPSPNHFWRLSLFGQFPRSTASQKYRGISLGDKSGFVKRVVLANVPSFRFSFWGNMRTHSLLGGRKATDLLEATDFSWILLAPYLLGTSCITHAPFNFVLEWALAPLKRFGINFRLC